MRAEQIDPAAPGIDHEPRPKRQRRDLVETLRCELGRLLHQLAQSHGLPPTGNLLANVRLNQIGKLLDIAVNRAQEEPGARQLVLVGRVLQELDHLGVGGGFLAFVMVKTDRAEQLAVGNHEPVGERKLRVDQLVSQHHVTELVREHHRQTRLVREDINQTATEHNRVPDSERLQR